MRFGALGKTIINQPEVALGILPGGSGTQRLPRMLGRARALEVILGCEDLDAETAERWGYLNRALPPEDLRPFVTRLAKRIARFPQQAIADAKAAALRAEPSFDEGVVRSEVLALRPLGSRRPASDAFRRSEALIRLGSSHSRAQRAPVRADLRAGSIKRLALAPGLQGSTTESYPLNPYKR